MFVSPFPGMLQELVAGKVCLLDALCGKFVHHLGLGSNGCMVGSRHPAGILAFHAGTAYQNILNGIIKHVSHVEGKNACWVPGTDHASIATEAKVVNKLAAQGIKKTDLTRDEFLKHAWEWTDEHGGIILKQLRKLGASCDWDRTAFTMDEKRSESVLKVFVDLYNKGLIYRGVRMVNWDPRL